MKLLINFLIIAGIIMFGTSAWAEKIGILSLYKGTVMIKTSEASAQWIKAKLNMVIGDKFIVKTSNNSEVQIKLNNGSLYKIISNKTIKMQDVLVKSESGTANNTSAKAKLNFLKNKLGKGPKSGNESPTAVAGVRGADISSQSKAPVKPTDLIWEE